MVKTTIMIRIKPVTQLSNIDLNIQNMPALPHPAKFTNYGEGLFVVLKAGQLIGFGSIQRYPHAPLTAGIAICLLYTSPSPRDATLSRMPSSA